MKYRIVETIVKDYNGKIVEYKYTIENRKFFKWKPVLLPIAKITKDNKVKIYNRVINYTSLEYVDKAINDLITNRYSEVYLGNQILAYVNSKNSNEMLYVNISKTQYSNHSRYNPPRFIEFDSSLEGLKAKIRKSYRKETKTIFELDEKNTSIN